MGEVNQYQVDWCPAHPTDLEIMLNEYGKRGRQVAAVILAGDKFVVVFERA